MAVLYILSSQRWQKTWNFHLKKCTKVNWSLELWKKYFGNSEGQFLQIWKFCLSNLAKMRIFTILCLHIFSWVTLDHNFVSKLHTSFQPFGFCIQKQNEKQGRAQNHVGVFPHICSYASFSLFICHLVFKLFFFFAPLSFLLFFWVEKNLQQKEQFFESCVAAMRSFLWSGVFFHQRSFSFHYFLYCVWA